MGLGAIAAGLSGRVLIFSNSSTLLIVVGAALAIYGAVQIVRSRSNEG